MSPLSIAPAGEVRRHDTVYNVQALRGVAALLVVWSHAKYALFHLNPTQIPPALATYMGGIGVDLFFVISGFVISMTAAKRHPEPVDFILARIARVCPLYLAITLVSIVFRQATADDMSPACIWNGLFYFPIFDFGTLTIPPLGVGWTLCFEMWFYVALSLLLVFCSGQRAAMILPLLFAILNLMGQAYRGSWYLPYFLSHPYVIEFAFGCLIYQWQHRLGRLASWVALGLAVGYFVLFSQNSGDLGIGPAELKARDPEAWFRLLQWGTPSALLMAGFVGLERNRVYQSHSILVWLGDISYSVYLTHRVPLSAVGHLGHFIGLRNPWLITAIVFALTLLCGWLCYVLIERPLTRRAQALVKKWSNHKHHERALRTA